MVTVAPLGLGGVLHFIIHNHDMLSVSTVAQADFTSLQVVSCTTVSCYGSTVAAAGVTIRVIPVALDALCIIACHISSASWVWVKSAYCCIFCI